MTFELWHMVFAFGLGTQVGIFVMLLVMINKPDYDA